MAYKNAISECKRIVHPDNFCSFCGGFDKFADFFESASSDHVGIEIDADRTSLDFAHKSHIIPPFKL